MIKEFLREWLFGSSPPSITWLTFVLPTIGAVVGFLLAQLTNVGTFLWKWNHRAKLEIRPLIDDSYMILGHSEQINQGEYADAEYYGIRVANVGKSIASNVRCQLIQLETKSRKSDTFSGVVTPSQCGKDFGNQ